jgi:hypothetical protein
MPSRNDFAPTSGIELAFQFEYNFAAEVRKADNRSDKKEEHGELGIHLSAPPTDTPQKPKRAGGAAPA